MEPGREASPQPLEAKMIWRILLLTYFATGAAWGPAFCCCRLSQLLESGWERITVSLFLNGSASLSLNGSAGPREVGLAGESCPRCRAKAERETAPRACCRGAEGEQSDSERNCPCRDRGEGKGGLWSFAFADQQLVRVASHADSSLLLPTATDGAGDRLRSRQSAHYRLHEHPPGSLFGRALLRAFQTLNC
jgi:hypothetical protein